MSPRESGGKTLPTAQRARQLRRAIELQENLPDNASAFARRLEIGPNRWLNVENGSPISRMLGETLVRKIPGLSVDWLYSGNRAGLSVTLARWLDEAESAGNRTTRLPRGS